MAKKKTSTPTDAEIAVSTIERLRARAAEVVAQQGAEGVVCLRDPKSFRTLEALEASGDFDDFSYAVGTRLRKAIATHEGRSGDTSMYTLEWKRISASIPVRFPVGTWVEFPASFVVAENYTHDIPIIVFVRRRASGAGKGKPELAFTCEGGFRSLPDHLVKVED